MLEGYSRTILAGAVAPAEASWVALMVLYTACLRYGVPECLISDSGGAFTSNDFEVVCTRLGIEHNPIESTKGESYLNWLETHFNIQRRLFDYQFSLTPPGSSSESIKPLSRPIIRAPIRGCSKTGFPRRFRSMSWVRPKAGDTPRTSWPANFRGRCFPAPPIAMGVSRCTGTISMWKRACPRSRCSCGSTASSCGRSWTTSCWPSITAAMIGVSTKSKTSAMACFTPHALRRPRAR
jgi:hypothetical protein